MKALQVEQVVCNDCNDNTFFCQLKQIIQSKAFTHNPGHRFKPFLLRFPPTGKVHLSNSSISRKPHKYSGEKSAILVEVSPPTLFIPTTLRSCINVYYMSLLVIQNSQHFV